MCSIGLSLSDAIDKLISDGKISKQLANSIMSNFDRVMVKCLQENVNTTLTLKVCPLPILMRGV